VSRYFHRFKSRSFKTQVQLVSTYSLPRAYPDNGSQETPPLACLNPHFHALLLCLVRSLFRTIGSSSRMDGGILTSCRVPQLLLATSCRTGSFEKPLQTA